MTREQAKQKLISFGVAEPTEEQISDLLNSINAETKKEKDRADSYKAKADKADELQTQLDDLNNQNLSDIEKANKALETANGRIAELEKTQAIATQRNSVAEKFKVTSEQAKQIVKDDGSLDYDVLGQIISDKENAAATAKEQEIANNATNPGGGSAGGSGSKDEKPEDVKNAESIIFGTQSAEQSAKDYYVMK